MPARSRKPKAAPLPLAKKLVLQEWLLSLLCAKSLAELCDAGFRHPDAERMGADGVTEFYRHLTHRLDERPEVPNAVLLRYDQNIVRHTGAMNYHRESRGEAIRWKYFQYIALLFTELYLDRWFRDPVRLLADLNAFLGRWNAENLPQDQLEPWTADDLRKVAFWQATGSGKTLLLHANILQYLHYAQECGKARELNRIILLTPNEGLSRQHLEELQRSGLQAELFDKAAASTGQGLMFRQQTVEIIDINKLGAESKDKTVAVDAFEGNNLVLVDEGHRGAKADGVWMGYRNQLCAQGFCFEYSATFAQALAGNEELAASYAKWILFDYSYRHFHGDGYGKDYRIYNLKQQQDDSQQELYLTAAVLSFYQQLRLWQDQREQFAAFQIERPLWVFFGAKVNAAEESDILEVLLFLARFVNDRVAAVRRLDLLLSGKDGLISGTGHQVFARCFDYLTTRVKMTAEDAWDDILRRVFNASAGGKLHVRNLKSAAGELSLSIGSGAEPFGVVNVGNESKLANTCREKASALLAVEDQDFGGSLFHKLNDAASQVHVLLGSRKFTEGWSSWRVSSIGLMNLGKSEGPTVVQLFGRGVRLKGWQTTLKRSAKLHELGLVKAPDSVFLLETLNVFGVKADYMETFREILQQEGVSTGEDWEIINVPALPTLEDLPSKKLKIVRVKEGLNYRKDGGNPCLALAPMRKHLRRRPVVLDWYPRLEAMASSGAKVPSPVAGQKKAGKLGANHVAFLDMEALYLGLQDRKMKRGWHNMALQRESIPELLADGDWYTLLIPPEELQFTGFGRQVRIWKQIADALLAGYCDRFYKFHQQAWEAENSEVVDLKWDDPNFDGLIGADANGYEFRVDPTEAALMEQLKALSKDVKKRALHGVGLASLSWDRHLYVPVFHLNGGVAVQVKPATLNRSEWDFIEGIKMFHTSQPEFFARRELYVLRNRSRKGIGFFEAGNFYPDFILWLLDGETQHVIFVDPKGLRQSEGWNDPKIEFHHEIKRLERRLNLVGLRLNSFILSASPYQTLINFGAQAAREDFDAAGVLFLEQGPSMWAEALLKRCGI